MLLALPPVGMLLDAIARECERAALAVAER